jgi:VanZ family protein
VEPSAHSVLSQWESFYVIVGSSAGGLTGLWFVVITLVADSSLPRTPESTNAFGTPNVAHFAAVLVLSALLSAPWQRLKDPAHLVGLMAVIGVVYMVIVTRRMLRQSGYKPMLEDWAFHMVGPFLAYVSLFVGAAGMAHDQEWALFLVGAVALLQLSIGIHNAWDTITYIVSQRRGSEGASK